MSFALALTAELLAAGVADAQTAVVYTAFDPRVVAEDDASLVEFTAIVSGSPSAVEIASLSGPTIPLTLVAENTYQVILSTGQLLDGYESGANHNVLGFLDVYSGSIRTTRVNIVVNVRHAGMPDIPVTRIGEVIQVSPHVVNMRSDSLIPSGITPANIVRQFYEFFEDDTDFLGFVHPVRPVRNRSYLGVRNNTQGLGLLLFDRGAEFGSASRLQGVVNFPIDYFFDLAETAAIHEIGHRWMNFSDAPELAQAVAHWPISDVAYGIMGLNLPNGVGAAFPYELIELPSGDYLLGAAPSAREFNDLELYLMGLVGPEEVADLIVFQNQNQGNQLFTGGVLQGPVDSVTIDDIIVSDGPRSPDVMHAQTHFRFGSVILSRGRLLDPDELAFFEHMAARGEATSELPFTSGLASGVTKPFRLTTSELATLSTATPALACYDADSDQICAGNDLCPFVPDPSQEDSGGLDTLVGDDIGDACQCGDIDDNGIVDLLDSVMLQRFLAGRPAQISEAKCSVIGGTECDGEDVLALRQALAGFASGLSQACDAAHEACFSGFVVDSSLAEDCSSAVNGDACHVFSDGFSWLLDESPSMIEAGDFCAIGRVEVALTSSTEYRHILGTQLVKTITQGL